MHKFANHNCINFQSLVQIQDYTEFLNVRYTRYSVSANPLPNTVKKDHINAFISIFSSFFTNPHNQHARLCPEKNLDVFSVLKILVCMKTTKLHDKIK